MTPPEAPVAGENAEAAEMPPAVSVCLTTLTKRSDFLRAARAKRVAMPGFVLQAYARDKAEGSGIRVGYTCSKKVGNAVARNKAKRRLRELARLVLPRVGHDGFDYVLIGRANTTASLPFSKLESDLFDAVKKIHKRKEE